jgi:hypothetical protein
VGRADQRRVFFVLIIIHHHVFGVVSARRRLDPRAGTGRGGVAWVGAHREKLDSS